MLRALRHPLIGAAGAFIVSGVVLLGAVGGYLLVHPMLGSASAAAVSLGGGRRLGPMSGTSGYRLAMIRAGDGAWFQLGGTYPSLPKTPEGTPVGFVQFTVARSSSGWPRETFVEWGLKVDSVDPAPGSPPTSDADAWRAMIAQALDHTFPGRYDLPASIRVGGSQGTTRYPWANVQNAAERLWYSPRWSGVSLAAAGAIALVVGVVLHRHPRRAPGACTACGYDLNSLPPGPCPECGASLGRA